jgi:hypothetical protein
MRYAILAQKNPEYLETEWRELSDLYCGGYQILKNARMYLPRMIGESLPRYEERLKVAAYMSYLGQIVDFLVANLFSHEITLAPAADAADPATPGGEPEDAAFYAHFAQDADRRGTPFAKLLRGALTTALVKGKAVVGIDFPRAGGALPANRAEEDQLGLARAYAFEVPVEQLINWELDFERGGFAFAILHRVVNRQSGPFAERGALVEEFKVWTLDPETGRVRWDLFRTALYHPDRPPRGDDEVTRVDGDETSFPQIPLVVLELPQGLWVGNKAGPVAKEHFQRRNILTAAENKSLFAIPVVKLGSEVGAPGMALPSEVQQDPSRGADPRVELANKGYLVVGAGDAVEFAEPSGGCYAVVESQLRDLKDELFRVVHMMAASVSNIGASLGRSGDSKEEDRKSTAVVLGALGAHVRDFAKRIYTAVSRARGDDVLWVPFGLDKYDCEPRDVVLQEAVQLDQIPIPSATFKKELKTRTALALLPHLQPATADVIKREIEAGVDEDARREADVHAAMRDLAEDEANAGSGDLPEMAGRAPGGPARDAPGRTAHAIAAARLGRGGGAPPSPEP